MCGSDSTTSHAPIVRMWRRNATLGGGWGGVGGKRVRRRRGVVGAAVLSLHDVAIVAATDLPVAPVGGVPSPARRPVRSAVRMR